MKRLIRKNSIPTREYVIPTTPLYNPLGKGEENSEFKETDEKSYSQMMNLHTMEEAKERERR